MTAIITSQGRPKPKQLDSQKAARVTGPPARPQFEMQRWKDSKNKEATAKWIMFATHGDALKKFAVAAGLIPGSVSLAKESPWDKPPYRIFVDQLRDARPYQYPTQAIPQMGQLEVDTIQKAIQAVALGRQSVDAATAQLCSTINEVLAR